MPYFLLSRLHPWRIRGGGEASWEIKRKLRSVRGGREGKKEGKRSMDESGERRAEERFGAFINTTGHSRIYGLVLMISYKVVQRRPLNSSAVLELKI